MKRFDDTNPGVLLKYYRPSRTLTRKALAILLSKISPRRLNYYGILKVGLYEEEEEGLSYKVTLLSTLSIGRSRLSCYLHS